jgi:hypothetical protein
MGLRHGDLNDTVLNKISIDEFEPKTGDVKDVVVVGFNLTEQAAGKDLYTFLNNSTLKIRDVELAPNTNENGYFMVFLEFDRDQDLPGKLITLVDEVKNVAGDLKWQASTHLTDDHYPIGSDELLEYLITDPEQYMDREAFEQMQAQRAEEARISEEQEMAESNSQKILDFLRDTNLREAGFSDKGLLTMMASQGIAQFEVISFGDAETALAEAGIDKAPIVESDYNTRIFNEMLGDLNAVKIAEYVVVFNTNTKQALVGKPC